MKKKTIDPKKKSEISNIVSIDGISNTALHVALVAQSNSIFSQQSKKDSLITYDMVTYQNPELLKTLLTDLSRKIMSSRHNGLSRKIQRRVKKMIGISRYLGLIHYIK